MNITSYEQFEEHCFILHTDHPIWTQFWFNWMGLSKVEAYNYPGDYFMFAEKLEGVGALVVNRTLSLPDLLALLKDRGRLLHK